MKATEAQARVIVLAQAIETADNQGKLLSDSERDQLDLHAARHARTANGVLADMGVVLTQRAEMLLDVVRGRNRALASLQGVPHLQNVMMWALPLGAMTMGVVIDRVLNPRRVDLLSEPFLGVLVWNLLVYLFLVLSVFRRRQQQPTPLLAALRRWTDRVPFRRYGGSALSTEIVALFFRRWHALTGALDRQRFRQLMHLAAAAWGAGAALSLMLRGTVKAYTVGWESTILNAEHVHFILHVLSWPLVRLLGIDAFTVDDIARLQFDVGAGARGNDGSRWLWLYVGLLMMFVVLPRLALAAVATWRKRQLAKSVDLDLDEPYFQRFIDTLVPANVRLGVVAHHADDRTVLEQVLVQPQLFDAAGSAARTARKLIGTERGDAMWMVELADESVARSSEVTMGTSAHELGNGPGAGHWRRWFGIAVAPTDTNGDANVDLVLHVVSQAGDLTAALPLLQRMRRPVLVLVRSGDGSDATQAQLIEQCRQHQRSQDLAMDILGFDEFAPCWVHERTLWNAVARRVPRARAQGCARLIAEWEQRNRLRFAAAMASIAGTLDYAARQAEEVPKPALLARASPEKRRVAEALRKAAMETVVARVSLRDHEHVQELLSMHGLHAGAADALGLRLEDGKYAVQSAVSARQAAMGGAATGAALGVSIDVMAGGMTLGAAAALGALAGGGSALVGALWNNRTAPSGGIWISLSDEMLMALAQTCLQRYLTVIHLHRGTSGADESERQERWKCEVFAEIQMQRKQMLTLFEGCRKGADSNGALVGLMDQIGRQVLLRLYPGARIGEAGNP